jgi:hypothetical protein
MKLIRTNILPSGIKLITVWPFIFTHNDTTVSDLDLRHEEIHGAQQLEMLVIGGALAVILAACDCGWLSLLALPLFFWWYLVEWLIKWAYYRNSHTAYKNIGFEREAYSNQRDLVYLYDRKPFAWFDYILKNK